jgi:E3 ubiquitin-protein ligase HERC2
MYYSLQLKAGDRVRVKPSVSSPKYKWGSINHLSVGVVTDIDRRDVTVDFPQQNCWIGVLHEMEMVPFTHPGVTCDGCQITPIAGARFRCKVKTFPPRIN